MDGKQSGKKKTPGKVLMLLWNKLQPEDYVRLPSSQNSYFYESLLFETIFGKSPWIDVVIEIILKQFC